MIITLELPDYERNEGFIYEWGSNTKVSISGSNPIIIQANQQGLMDMAKILLSLAQPEVPDGIHVHLDDQNTLQKGSNEIIIERMK